MVDYVEALGSGFGVSRCHSSKEGDRVVSEFAVGCHDEGVKVRVVVVFPSFVLFPPQRRVFGRWCLVEFDSLGG